MNWGKCIKKQINLLDASAKMSLCISTAFKEKNIHVAKGTWGSLCACFFFSTSQLPSCAERRQELCRCYVVTGLMMWKEAFTFMIMFRTLSEFHFLLYH